MTENKTLLVINAIVNKENKEAVQAYLGQITQVFVKNGGKPVAKYKTLEQLDGENSPEMIAIIAFSDSEAIKKMLKSDDFTSLADLRAKAFTKLNLMICDEM